MKILKLELSQWMLILVASALVVTNVFLILQNMELRTALARSKKFVTDVGYKFAAVPGTALGGENAPIEFSTDGKRTVLFVFNTNCEYCHQQYPHWRKLIESLDRSNWNIVAITSQSDANQIAEHLEKNGLSGVDVRMVPVKDFANARLGFTPMTLTVDSDGTVLNVWPGLWTQNFDLEH